MAQTVALSVPRQQWRNPWHAFHADLEPEWAGTDVQIVVESEVQTADPEPASFLIGATGLRTHGERDPDRPDVVVLTLDTLRADMLGTYGKDGARTPVLDRLASEGTVFETTYATSNATAPSHSTLFTSLFSKDHNIYDNNTTISPEVVTLAEQLSERGYETHALVSVRMLVHLSGLGQGFVHFSGPPRGERPGHETLAQLAESLPEKAGAPLFLWFHLFDPHSPYLPPEDWAREFAGADGPEDDVDAQIARYRAEISYTDHLVGQLLALLEERGYTNDLQLVIVADHGESLTEHGINFQHKGIYSVVTQIPLILHGSSAPAGKRVDDLVSMVDVMPTVFDMAGLRPRGVMRGKSLLPIAHGEPGRDVVFFEEVHHKAVGLRTKDHVYIRYLRNVNDDTHSRRKGDQFLFAVGPDRWETQNLVTELPDIAERYRVETERWLSHKMEVSAITGNLTPELRAELEAMGYTIGGGD